jgi:signal transduction histidine kinase
MKKLIFIILVVILSGCSENKDTSISQPQATNGALDLTGWSLQDDGMIKLSGEWNFYQDKLLDSKNDLSRYSPQLLDVPSLWEGAANDKERVHGQGFATYHLSVSVDEDDFNSVMAMYIPTIHTSYRIWINGEMAVENGVVGESEQQSKPRYKPNVVFFQPEQRNNSIIIQVSNFSHYKGGIAKELILGTPNQILDMKQDRVALNLFLFGSLMIMALYHFGLYLRRPTDKSSLFFGLLCIVGALRTILVDQMYLIEWFPSFNWSFALKLEYLTIYIGAYLYLSFIRSLFPNELNKYVYMISVLISLIFSSIVIIFPADHFTLTLKLFQFFMFALLFYLQFVLALASFRKREAAIISFITGMIFFVCTVNDFLYYTGVIYTTDLAPLGFFILIISQSVNLSLKFTKSFKQVEQMRENLEQMNYTLEEKVRERTRDLEQSQFEAAAALAEKSLLTERNRIANDLHDILGHMLTTTSVQIEVAKKVVNKDIDLAVTKMDLSQELIRKGLNDIRGTVHKLKEDSVTLLFIPSLIHLIEMTEKMTDIEIDYRIDEITVELPPSVEKVIYHTLQEGLTNGIRHGECTKFSFQLYLDQDETLHFYLRDNGKGTHEITYGFGLATMQERIKDHNGEVFITSEPGKGFTIQFFIPILNFLT